MAHSLAYAEAVATRCARTFRSATVWAPAAPLPRLLARRPLHTPLAAAAAAFPTAESGPLLPLCERPAIHVAQLTSLLAWRDAAASRAAAAGARWDGEPDAPTAEDLQTELVWLLDDAVAGLRPQGNDAWKAKAWRDIERGEAEEGSDALEVNLRESVEGLETLWRRRLDAREPLQYLTSCAFWRDLVLSVGPGVLIPRPETELIIDFAEEAAAATPALASGAWADLGTGSGALAVALARAFPDAPRVWAVDLAAAPAAHAAFNASRAGVGDRVSVVRGSWYDPLRAAGVRQLAGIVSNPPYIPANLIEGLQAEVGLFEPALALSGGDGLGVDALAPICRGAAEMLAPGGFLALETAGGEQSWYVAQLLQHLRLPAAKGSDLDGDLEAEPLAFENVRVRTDLRGVDRFVTATRTAEGVGGGSGSDA